MSTTATAKCQQRNRKKLKKFCDKNYWEGAHKELYAKDAVSIEPQTHPDLKRKYMG
jgi:hypothetical protein